MDTRRGLIDTALEDFPKSERWRLQTDGWQATQGPNNFRKIYYDGMNIGLEFINTNSDAKITPELIEGIYHSAYRFESNYVGQDNFRKGYAERIGGFEIFLPLDGLEHEAGVSLDGIDELFAALKVALSAKEGRELPQYGIEIKICNNPAICFSPYGHHLVLMDSIPTDETLKRWPIQNAAYIRVKNDDNNDLFYFNKINQKFQKIDFDSAALEAFDAQLKPMMGARALSIEELCIISSLTKHMPFLQRETELKNELIAHLMNASKSKNQYTGLKIEDKDLTTVNIMSYNATRKDVLLWVQADIDHFHKELSNAKIIKDQQERKVAEINAINHFIRKLHQSHYFPDGNGRTFVFLLANMLLLQNGYGMKITENPAHYAAYSSKEMLQETLHDLEHFDEYKITKGKEYLANLTGSDINIDFKNGKNRIKTVLLKSLSQHALIAMAQISELYERIKSDNLIVPKDYAHTKGSSFLSKTPPQTKARQRILALLKDAYVSKLNELVTLVQGEDKENHIGYGSKESAAEILKAIVSTHIISKDCDHKTIKILIKRYNENAKSVTPLATKVSSN